MLSWSRASTSFAPRAARWRANAVAASNGSNKLDTVNIETYTRDSHEYGVATPTGPSARGAGSAYG